MRIYRTKKGILIENSDQYYALQDQNWDTYINDDELLSKLENTIKGLSPIDDPKPYMESILIPAVQQEIWASGVTYYNSKLGREEEAKAAGGGDFYANVYVADRPELFFKSTPARAVAHQEFVRIREDSTWDVPEPEFTLCISSSGKIIGYTIGNDMSSRSIEGENPLYLPQAKTYDGCAGLGPCILVTDQELPPETKIHLKIDRDNSTVFEEEIAINQIKRKFEDLVAYLFRECSFPNGVFLMTGTGIVPPSDFTLQSQDIITINVDAIGTLINTVK